MRPHWFFPSLLSNSETTRGLVCMDCCVITTILLVLQKYIKKVRGSANPVQRICRYASLPVQIFAFSKCFLRHTSDWLDRLLDLDQALAVCTIPFYIGHHSSRPLSIGVNPCTWPNCMVSAIPDSIERRQSSKVRGQERLCGGIKISQ